MGCGGLLYDTQGVVTSPNFPRPYSQASNCEWTLKVPPGQKIELAFSCKFLRLFAICMSLKYYIVMMWTPHFTIHPLQFQGSTLKRREGPFYNAMLGEYTMFWVYKLSWGYFMELPPLWTLEIPKIASSHFCNVEKSGLTDNIEIKRSESLIILKEHLIKKSALYKIR